MFLNKIECHELSAAEELPSLDAVMSEIDSDIDIDSINSSNIIPDKPAQTTTSISDEQGSILRHVIFQGVTTQIGSAAVCLLHYLYIKQSIIHWPYF